MYMSFRVNNFRCFRQLTVDEMTRINLITGINNVGKTALLEAFFVHSGLFNPELVARIDVFRGLENRKIELGGRWFESPWNYIYYDFDTTKTIEIEGAYDNSKKRKLRLRTISDPKELTDIYRRFLHSPQQTLTDEKIGLQSDAHVLEFDSRDDMQEFKYYLMVDRKGSRIFPIPPAIPYQVVFMRSHTKLGDEEVERFGKLQKNKREKLVLDALKVVEPRLTRLTMLVENNMQLIEGDIGKSRLVPMQLMGEGMNRLVGIILAIAEASNGVALIDEIENGFHYSVLHKVWQVVKKASEIFDTQVIATTHSFECISAAQKAFRKDERHYFSLHRLERTGENVSSVNFNQKSLSVALDSNLEVR
jgi:AAA15 family ATPase/GTPase